MRNVIAFFLLAYTLLLASSEVASKPCTQVAAVGNRDNDLIVTLTDNADSSSESFFWRGRFKYGCWALTQDGQNGPLLNSGSEKLLEFEAGWKFNERVLGLRGLRVSGLFLYRDDRFGGRAEAFGPKLSWERYFQDSDRFGESVRANLELAILRILAGGDRRNRGGYWLGRVGGQWGTSTYLLGDPADAGWWSNKGPGRFVARASHDFPITTPSPEGLQGWQVELESVSNAEAYFLQPVWRPEASPLFEVLGLGPQLSATIRSSPVDTNGELLLGLRSRLYTLPWAYDVQFDLFFGRAFALDKTGQDRWDANLGMTLTF